MATLDTVLLTNRYAQLPADLFDDTPPTPLPEPRLVAFSEAAAGLLDLEPAEAHRPDFAELFAGNRLLQGSRPIATLYAGHQFGSWVPQLGDGRAILLGEATNARGESWELQLKGAGPTRYSRGGDGRSVLRSAIREFLCSEAMHGLGIPTTRALAVVGSPLPVYREEVETAATLVRLAPSHVRFGHFEVLSHRRREELLRVLADDVIARHFPELDGTPDKYAGLLAVVVRRTAELVAAWQSVGFAHGVLNTDNMSLLGLTIDYGPFGFLDAYDPSFICNHSDHGGRYAFERQPQIAHWNCRALAQALLPLMERDAAVAALDTFAPLFHARHAALLRAKLGFATEESGDPALVRDLLALMAASGADWTRTWRALSDLDPSRLRDDFVDREAFDAWTARYLARLGREGGPGPERSARMRRVNPKFVLRNWLAQVAIERAQAGDFTEVQRLHRVLEHPFDDQPEHEPHAAAPPDWGRHLAVSCSS